MTGSTTLRNTEKTNTEKTTWIWIAIAFIFGWVFGWLFAVVHGDINIHKTSELTVTK